MRISDWSSDVCSSDLDARRRRADEGIGAEGLSLQRQLGPRAPRRYRPRERAWARLLRAAGRRTAEERHRTAAAASPLGLARGARRQGRVAQPRQCGLVRSEEHTSEIQSLMRISSVASCLITQKIHALMITVSI